MPTYEIEFEVEVAENKYRYIHYKNGSSEVLRHNEKWWDTTGSKFIYLVMSELFKLRGRKNG